MKAAVRARCKLFYFKLFENSNGWNMYVCDCVYPDSVMASRPGQNAAVGLGLGMDSMEEE